MGNKIIYISISIFALIAVLAVGAFIVKAVALCRMARNRKMKSWWLGFIPFANFILIGQLAGPIRPYKINFKNMGIWVLVFVILIAVLDIIKLIVFLPAIQHIFSHPELLEDITDFEAYLEGYMSSMPASVLYTISMISTPIIDCAYFAAFIILNSALFGKYAPKQRLLFTLLSACVPMAFNIILICIMDKKPYAAYDEYHKEQMAKRFGQAYNPYENSYNESNKHSESPFDDYSDNNSNGETTAINSGK